MPHCEMVLLFGNESVERGSSATLMADAGTLICLPIRSFKTDNASFGLTSKRKVPSFPLALIVY
jgi:hypothetical protein